MLVPQWVTDRKEEEKKMSNHMAEVEEERKWNKGNECAKSYISERRTVLRPRTVGQRVSCKSGL